MCWQPLSPGRSPLPHNDHLRLRHGPGLAPGGLQRGVHRPCRAQQQTLRGNIRMREQKHRVVVLSSYVHTRCKYSLWPTATGESGGRSHSARTTPGPRASSSRSSPIRETSGTTRRSTGSSSSATTRPAPSWARRPRPTSSSGPGRPPSTAAAGRASSPGSGSGPRT